MQEFGAKCIALCVGIILTAMIVGAGYVLFYVSDAEFGEYIWKSIQKRVAADDNKDLKITEFDAKNKRIVFKSVCKNQTYYVTIEKRTTQGE